MAKGLTDAQLDAMDEMEARQNLYGTAARVLESPDAVPMTDAQMDQRATSDSVMQATPFGQKTMPQSAPQPPQADFREPAKPLTDAELNAQEDNLYYDPAYEMPFEEFAPVHARRQQEKNTVGSFVDGAVAAGQGLVSLTAEMGGELRDNFTSNIFRPDRFATQNFVTLKEGGRKAGLEFAKFIDWVGNTARDHATDVRRQEQVRGTIAQKLQAEGKLSGDLRGDLEIINREFAAAKKRGETAPTPLEENANVEQAFEDYRRGKNFDREIAGVGNYNIGQTPVTQESSEARATNPITGEVMEPQRALATGASLAMAADNLLPAGAGVMSKARILRRLSSITGVPLKMTENVANAGADALQRGAMRITDRVQDLTGMNAAQQTTAATALTGGVGYLSTQGEGAPAALGGVATGVLSILPIMKFGGAILRRTGAAAGGGYAIVREMGAGGAGVAGAEAADAMAKSGVFPQRYARHMQPGGASADSTLRRVAQDPENPQMLRRLSRTANNLGATQAFRLADDAVSSAAVSGLAAAPFALVAPDAEQGGQIVGGAVLLGTTIGTATRSFGRRPAEVDADIARMLVDVTESNGDAASLMSLSHDSLSQLAAMQGVLRNKVKLIPLRGQDYRANADLRAAGGETAAGLYVEKDAKGSARIFVNMGHTAPVDGTVSVRPDADKGGSVIDITAADGTVDSTHVPQGVRLLVKTGDAVSANQRLAQDLSPNRIIPHEIGHAILTSDILDGQPRNDLRNLVNQQYATDGVAARGREYATRLVDKDILVGAIEDAPVNLTDAQINDISSGKTTLADVMKGQPVSEQARQRLIDQRVEELSERSVENGQDPLDWARDEIIAETFASEAPAIDFRAIRRDAMFPRLAESILASGGRVLEVMGARLDPGTGKLLDNPSVLFRDNPLFQDRIMQKRVKEYVRAYDQYLVGLEEAGTAAPRGVELARSNRPEDLGRSTHVKLRDEGRGVLENDFLFQRPDGTYSFKPQKLVNQTEASRAAQIKTLYDAKKFVPVNSTEFGRRKVNGRETVGGPVLPPQFDFFTHFPQHVREFARSMEQSRAEGGSWDIDYNAIGTGSSGRYRVTNLGNVRAIQRETVPFGWQVTKANHLLAASLDLNAFRASSMKAINKGDLGLFNNDMKQVEADLKTYLANHRAGLPGEATIGIAKRDMLNGLIGTGTAVQRTANPLYYELNPRGSIRTWRVDRLNDAKPTGRTGYFFDYDKINNNRMPQQIPRGAQGMPDAPASGKGDGMSEQWDLYGERLRDDVESWSPARDTGRIDYDMQDVVQSFVDFARKNSQLTGDDLAKAFYRDEKPTASQRKKLNAALENVGQPPKAAPRGQAMPDAPRPIRAAVVAVGDRIFTGTTHAQAFERAVYEGAVRSEGGKIVAPPGTAINADLFMTSDGKIIDRFEASRLYDSSSAERAIEKGTMQPRPAGSQPIRAQAMPDSLESVPTDQLLRQYEENQGYLGLSTLGMREGRPVRGGAAQTRELLRRNEAISAELQRRGVRSEDAQLQQALQRRGQAMPDVGSFDEDAGAYLIAAGDGESLPVYQQADKRGKPAVDGTGKAKFVPVDYDLLHGPGITKYTGPGPEDTTKPNYKGLAYDITQKGQREIDAAIDSGAVDSAANRVVDFTVEAMKNREIAAGKGWYSRMREKLLSAFGEKGRELFAQLLGATSAKTPVEPNFLQAFDAFEGINSGRYDRHRKAYLDMLESEDGNNLAAVIVERGYTNKVRAVADSLSKEARKLKGKKKAEVLFKAGKLRDLAKKPASQWTRKDRFDITILAEDILPLRSNGKKFNSNSHAVLKVIAGTWLNNRKSPKTPNFAGNLTGRTLQATIDVWAARHLRELLYGGGNEPWRIQPRSEVGVNPQDFALGQIIMQRAAKKLDMNPDDLQAILWFAEKNKWDANGWTGTEGANKSSFDTTFDRAFPSGQKPLTFQEVSKILSEED
jgi:hypothetical protein